MKNFILDTNVLVADPQAMFKFGQENTVIVPMTVIEELDGLKKRPGSVGHAARQVARELSELREKGRLNKGVEMPNGGRLIVETEIAEPTFKIVGKVINDHYILQVALTLMERGVENVVLITEDHVLQLLGDINGVETQRYEAIAAGDISFYDSTPVIWVEDEALANFVELGEMPIGTAVQKAENSYLTIKGYGGGSILGLARRSRKNIIRFDAERKAQKIRGANAEQKFAMDALMNPEVKVVCLAGKAGTGKTLLALAAGLEQTIEAGAIYEKITICRPVVSVGDELGFLPGSLAEKLSPWMGPIRDNLDVIFSKADKRTKQDMMELLVEQGKMEVAAISYIRGRSLPNQFIIVDEAQQLTPHEIKTILTRAGEGTKLVLCGDPYQIDSAYLDQYTNGLSYTIDRLGNESLFSAVTLHKGERSELAETASRLM